MSAATSGHVVKHRCDASGETFAVGLHGVHLDVLLQFHVLLADTRHVEVEINTAHLFHKP